MNANKYTNLSGEDNVKDVKDKDTKIYYLTLYYDLHFLIHSKSKLIVEFERFT